jgi:hypothetical protein
MGKFVDLTGRRFDRALVVGREPLVRGSGIRPKWVCRCDCGTIWSVVGSALKDGLTRSCGCHRREIFIQRNTIHGHTLNHPRLHLTWRKMHDRCKNPRNRKYPDYGGRGIQVCPEWEQFEEFLKWSESSGYDDTLTIDRRDNNSGYSPANCRWATALEQASNKRNNTYFTLHGVSKILPEWSREFGIDCGVVRSRIKVGWDLQRALTEPVKSKRRPT